MNTNKIAQLAAQACNCGDPALICATGIPPQYIEKFTELIVQECIDIMTDTGDSEWNSYGRASANTIKEHFRIK